ncbi:MAG TPA: hypothetical protein VHM20_05795, partial [Gammaproteobacteria bacterium]|nr:hypothetical protein [Gammaproteobacteria bacterium]
MLSNANNTPKPESKNSTGDYINPDVTLPRATTIVGNFVKEGQEKITTSLDLLFSTKAGETSPQEFALHSDIQKNMARKYINGLLHICHCTADKSVKKQLKKDTLNLWNRFIAIPIPTDNDVKILENDLAICLMKALHKHFPNIDLEHAHKQVTMARDLVILLNKINPTESDYIVTQKKHTLHGNVKKKLNILEKTAYLKVSEQYYEKFLEKDNPSSLAKKWLESTLKYAGFHKKAKNTWIQNLLTLYKDEFIQAGVSISSSGRWHFLPGNLREHSIQVTEVDAKDAKEQKEFEPPPANVNKVSVVAMGTVCAFNADKSIQEELALEQLDEVYQLHRQKKAEYKKLYGSLADTFYFNYQTILSPV